MLERRLGENEGGEERTPGISNIATTGAPYIHHYHRLARLFLASQDAQEVMWSVSQLWLTDLTE